MKEVRTIPIDKFIEDALYNKKYGYYSKTNPFGKSGDYITAPGISFLFSEMIAIWIIAFWENIGKPKKLNLIELGPGNGDLCKILIKTFKKFPNFNKCINIYLYEKSNLLKNIQKKNIKEKKINWLNSINKIKDGPLLFFGNEFFDAIPIKQFKKKNNKIYEKHLNLQNGLLNKIILKKAPNEMIKELKKFNLIKSDGVIEYPKLGLEELNVIIRKIKKFKGGLLLIDYGFLENRNIDTLQSVKNHKKNKIFENIGKADITSHVNFKLLRDYFVKNKLKTNKIVTQSFFLKKIGIINRAEILSKRMSFKDKSDLYFRLERILDPKYMGRLFKVIFAYKSKKKFLLGFE